MCPPLTVVEARPPLYVKYHHKLIEVVDTVLPVSEVLSIDEMRCALRGRFQERETALGLARQIKRTIATTVGIHVRCSIGIAPNGFLAKTASDMQKPNGLVVIDEGDLPEILFPLKLTDFCGIAESREARLHACGIRTVEQLCRAPKELLRAAWNGIEGNRMYAMLRGEMMERPATQRCTVGHSHVLEPKYRTRPLAEAVLQRLLQKAAARLRSLGYMAAALGVALKFLGKGTWSDEIRFVETQDTLDFYPRLSTGVAASPVIVTAAVAGGGDTLSPDASPECDAPAFRRSSLRARRSMPPLTGSIPVWPQQRLLRRRTGGP